MTREAALALIGKQVHHVRYRTGSASNPTWRTAYGPYTVTRVDSGHCIYLDNGSKKPMTIYLRLIESFKPGAPLQSHETSTTSRPAGP